MAMTIEIEVELLRTLLQQAEHEQAVAVKYHERLLKRCRPWHDMFHVHRKSAEWARLKQLQYVWLLQGIQVLIDSARAVDDARKAADAAALARAHDAELRELLKGLNI